MIIAIRKLPLSFTRLAAFGVEERCRGFDRVVLTCGNDEELARSREVGASEHRRRDEALASLRMCAGERLGQGDADCARRYVDRASRQTGDDAFVTQDDVLHGIIVRQHGDDGVAPAGVRDAGGGLRALSDQRFGLRSRPIVDCHVVPRLHEVRSHAGTHLPESDEANVHGRPFLMRGGAQCPSLLRSVQARTPHCLRRAAVLQNRKHGVLFRRRHQTRRCRRSGPEVGVVGEGNQGIVLGQIAFSITE